MSLLLFGCLTFLCCGVIATAHSLTHPSSRLTRILPLAVQEVLYQFLLGHTEDDLFLLYEEDILSRMAVLGASGSGKSKFLYLLFASLMRAGRGFLLMDPHGDLAHALTAFAAARIARGDRVLLNRLHVLEPSRRGFRIDPFHNAPRRGTVSRNGYYKWLKARVDRIVRNLLRRVSEADQDVMNRMKRWLANILYACGVAIDANNMHVGLHKALVFTVPGTEEFDELMEKVFPHLPPEVQSDFEILAGTKKPLDRERWVESTINRLRSILSPLVQEMFAPGPDALSMLDLVRSGAFVLVSLQETRGFSHDEKQIIGGLLLDELLIAKQAEEDQVVEYLEWKST